MGERSLSISRDKTPQLIATPGQWSAFQMDFPMAFLEENHRTMLTLKTELTRLNPIKTG